LLDAVTHDLRTPLTSIKASITTLLDDLDGKPNGEQTIMLDAESRREMFEVINEESDRLNRFIGGLIELARIEAGEMHLRRRWGAIDEIITAALARAEPLTRHQRIEVEMEEELPVVSVDPRAVSEVVYTLIDNAAKYSLPETTIRLAAQRAGMMLQISVEDEGKASRRICANVSSINSFARFVMVTSARISLREPVWDWRLQRESSKLMEDVSGSKIASKEGEPRLSSRSRLAMMNTRACRKRLKK
jgi:K+-sensing histidine kinase KdpD